jgi:putative chitinase|tara:strand:- start:203 stop:1051 length:849 start_codon:yes stop_codon:yes gene_type:complete
MAKEHFKFNFEEWMAEELIHRDDWKDWYNAMCEILPLWEVNTIERVAGFVAQCGHESGGFRVLSENLNYSAKALNSIFPKYFRRAGRDANEYHRQPEKIANVIYASRMDNGDTASGDGWRFRGGGILQLTGRYNYTEFAKAVEKTPEDAVDYVRTKAGALDSACWFWDTNNINKYCDAQDIVGMTKRINGGTIGLDDRKKHYIHALDVLGGDFEEPEIEYNQTIRQGSRGPLVAEVQEKLDIAPADGIFGPGTAKIVRHWQSSNGLVADGIVGPKTLEKLLG